MTRLGMIGIERRGFWIRKEPKKHGINTYLEGNLLSGDRIVMIDDTITTGGSIYKGLERAGINQNRMVKVVDRSDLLSEVHSIYKIKELLNG